MLFWTTPILYELRHVPERLQLLILLSPVSPFVVAYQQFFFYREWPDGDGLAGGRDSRARRVHRRRVAVPGVRGSVHGAVVVPVIDAQAVSKRFLLRHNASGRAQGPLPRPLASAAAAVGRGVLGAKNVSLRIERGDTRSKAGRRSTG